MRHRKRILTENSISWLRCLVNPFRTGFPLGIKAIWQEMHQSSSINSLSPGRSECDSKDVIFDLVLLIGIFRSSHFNALWWMPHDLTDDLSTLVQVMAWCRQATSHYLSQCWLSSLSPYGIARPQWVKIKLEIARLKFDSPRNQEVNLRLIQSWLS